MGDDRGGGQTSGAPAEVRLGSVLVSLLEPDRGREVEFNRWYERDHFYSGCMVGPHFFAGRRFVATARLKDERFSTSGAPDEPGFVSDIRDGSYLALYWLLAGHHDEAERWSVDRVRSLIDHDRMMSGRRPVHAGFYDRCLSVARERDAGVPAELALDHPYAGVSMTSIEAPEGAARDALAKALETSVLPAWLEGSEIGLCIGFTPRPLPDDAPAYVERPKGLERRLLLLGFFESDPGDSNLARAEALDAELARKGLGRVRFSAPFIPTVPGTDRYADELW